MREQFASAEGSLDIKKPYPFIRSFCLVHFKIFASISLRASIFLFSFRLASIFSNCLASFSFCYSSDFYCFSSMPSNQNTQLRNRKLTAHPSLDQGIFYFANIHNEQNYEMITILLEWQTNKLQNKNVGYL